MNHLITTDFIHGEEYFLQTFLFIELMNALNDTFLRVCQQIKSNLLIKIIYRLAAFDIVNLCYGSHIVNIIDRKKSSFMHCVVKVLMKQRDHCVVALERVA